jgi:hypothetical protein
MLCEENCLQGTQQLSVKSKAVHFEKKPTLRLATNLTLAPKDVVDNVSFACYILCML